MNKIYIQIISDKYDNKVKNKFIFKKTSFEDLEIKYPKLVFFAIYASK